MTTPHRPTPRRTQRGAVLLFALIALVVLLIGTVALMRSMNTSLFTAGNFGFKRDLTNQGERAVTAVLDLVQTGALGTEGARQANSVPNNYSATVLATNPQGVPLALLNDTTFATVGVAGNDITLADMGVTVRYVVDRLCATAGPASQDGCTLAGNVLPAGTSASELQRAEHAAAAASAAAGTGGAVPPQVVYRVSIRVDGPRGTQSFFQSTFTI